MSLRKSREAPGARSLAPRGRLPIRRRPQPGYRTLNPTWRQARPGRIARSLEHARSRPTGGWYVVGTSTQLDGDRSLARTIAGREIVLWRGRDGQVLAGPGACPHLGALLDDCPVLDGDLVCRWHGMTLDAAGRGSWQTFPTHDDGVLLWARVPTGEDHDHQLSVSPILSPRPPLAESVTAVITRRGSCEPSDIIANRLDPWHGAWFHPYSFSHLQVDDRASNDQRLVTDVTFRLGRRLGVPVRAEFVCPDRRTIVMRIIEGEGIGSVVETHATPITAAGSTDPITVMTEVTIAHSARTGFRLVRRAAALLRPAMRYVAGRLWVDDLTYAERRFELRRRGEFPG